MKKLTLEYIAGFVDGEGSFMIKSSGPNHYCPGFCISNTDLQILQRIQRFFSLGLKIRTKVPASTNCRPCYDLEAKTINTCRSIARQLEPHLRLKKKQAQLIMQYPRARHINIGGIKQVDVVTKAYVLKLRKRMRLLNKVDRPTQESNEDLQPEPDPQLNLLDLNQKEVI